MYFELFELPPTLALDVRDLEKRFYALSRRLHPDLFARKPPAERDKALETSAVLNDAYRTLKDPIQRALYLLKLEGFETGEQSNKDVPPELLEEVFELNMALEELRGGDEDAREQLKEALKKFEAMKSEIDEERVTKFAEWDASHSRDTLTAIRALLNRRKYVGNLIAQASEAIGNVPDRV